MYVALIVFHVLVSLVLVLVVLLQTGRGAELGAAFGGLGQVTYGRGQSTFLSKLTTSMAVVFMITSVALTFLTGERPTSSLMQQTSAPVQAPAPAPAGAPAANPASPVTAAPAPVTPAPVTPAPPPSTAPVQPASPKP
ncbi:MAG TPA: preprotein translocase subunit SecG [bacterium]|nr:preprotein translocase subunit SecG [bacterium]